MTSCEDVNSNGARWVPLPLPEIIGPLVRQALQMILERHGHELQLLEKLSREKPSRVELLKEVLENWLADDSDLFEGLDASDQVCVQVARAACQPFADFAATASHKFQGAAVSRGSGSEHPSPEKLRSLLLTGVTDGFFTSEGPQDPRIWTTEIGYTRENRLNFWKEWCERAVTSNRPEFASLPAPRQEAIRFSLAVIEALEYTAEQFERGFHDA